MVSMSQQKKVLPLKHFFVNPVQALSALGAATFAISDLTIVINLFYHPLQYSQVRAFINANPVNFVFVWVPITRDKVVKVIQLWWLI